MNFTITFDTLMTYTSTMFRGPEKKKNTQKFHVITHFLNNLCFPKYLWISRHEM